MIGTVSYSDSIRGFRSVGGESDGFCDKETATRSSESLTIIWYTYHIIVNDSEDRVAVSSLGIIDTLYGRN